MKKTANKKKKRNSKEKDMNPKPSKKTKLNDLINKFRTFCSENTTQVGFDFDVIDCKDDTETYEIINKERQRNERKDKGNVKSVLEKRVEIGKEPLYHIKTTNKELLWQSRSQLLATTTGTFFLYSYEATHQYWNGAAFYFTNFHDNPPPLLLKQWVAIANNCIVCQGATKGSVRQDALKLASVLNPFYVCIGDHKTVRKVVSIRHLAYYLSDESVD